MKAIGIIGLGGIGLAVAKRLLAAGVVPLGFRRSSMAAFAALGGRPCTSLRELVLQSDLVLNCSAPEAADDLCRLYATLTADQVSGQVFVDLGVSPMALRERLRDAVQSAGAAALDAPIMGNPPLVEAGRAVVYASGDRDVADSVMDCLKLFAAKAPYVGPFGHGTRLKFASNLLLAVHTAAAAEAVAYTRRLGVDPRLLLEHAPPIARSGVLDARGPQMVERRFGRGAGSTAMLLDVVDIIYADAAAFQCELPALAATAALLRRAAAAGFGDRDSPSIVALLDGAGAVESAA